MLHLFLLLMNNFNKTEAAIFPMTFLEDFGFPSDLNNNHNLL